MKENASKLHFFDVFSSNKDSATLSCIITYAIAPRTTAVSSATELFETTRRVQLTHMVSLSLAISALVATCASAFAPAGTASRRNFLSRTGVKALVIPEDDDLGNNIAVKNLLLNIEESRLLSQVAASGLLSKAQEAGISLSNLEGLLKLASDNPEILVLVEASGPELLPVLPKLVELAPPALPLLAAAISIPPALLQVAGAASLALAGLIVYSVPDDSVLNVATQTLAVGLLGVAAPVASFAGATILGQLTK